MEIEIGEQRALVLEAQLNLELAQERAWSKKGSAFGTFGRMSSLLKRTRDEEYELIYTEQRYEPIWHVVCKAHVIYDREREFQLSVKEDEVKAVTISSTDYDLVDGKITIPGVEHCAEEARSEVYVDGVSGQHEEDLVEHIKFPAAAIPFDELNTFVPDKAVVLSSSLSASAVVRQVLAGMSKQIRANAILDEGLEVQVIDLYYRPVYAFTFRWTTRGRDGVIECDGLSGDISTGGKTYEGYTSEPLDPVALFDLKSGDLDELVPGGHVFIAPSSGAE